MGLFNEVGRVPPGADGSNVEGPAAEAVGRVIGRFCLVKGFFVDFEESGAGAAAGLNIIGGA